MTHDNVNIPAIYSIPRFTTLITSIIVSLASGTNYVYSAYAPQMGAQLGITHTALNIVALAGNFGVYTFGPIWGRIVDKRGPRILLSCGFVFLLGGYMGIRYLYDRGLPEGDDELSLFAFAALVIFSYLTGAGGNGGLTSSVNSTARTFPDHMRGITTGLVISGFGLSAFLFSTIARTVFAGNTSSFLFLLAVGTSLPMILGLFFIRPYPLPPHEPSKHEEYEPVPEHVSGSDAANRLGQSRSDSHAPLLSGRKDEDDEEDEESTSPGYVGEAGVPPDHHHHRRRESDVELSPQRRGQSRSMSPGTALAHDLHPNVYGWTLWKSSDFHLLFSILSLLSGTGLMYINNVGAMSQALYAFHNPLPKYDPLIAARYQTTQVSSLSLNNCFGRILIGLITDSAKSRWSVPRSYSLVLVSAVCLLSQIMVASVTRVEDLWMASAVMGLGYGAVFSLLPTVCLEWFGMPHFSENWGYLSMSPMLAGNLFSMVFGYNLDKNEDAADHELLNSIASASVSSTGSTSTAARSLLARGVGLLRRNIPASPQTEIRCSKGVDCYVDSIYLTIAATVLALGLSVWAGLNDRRKIRAAGKRRAVLRRRVGEDEGE